MYVYLNVSGKNLDRLKMDKDALLSSAISLPLEITRWKINADYENNLQNHKYAMADYTLESDIGMIWFYEKYFKVDKWKNRQTIFFT